MSTATARALRRKIDFADLLALLAEQEGDFRIRFMTSHPKDASRKLIDTIASHEKICKNLHLPVQSGSDRILVQMNRKYDTAQYLGLIDYARQTIPQMTFSSDIIVGFPGETEEDFEQTVAAGAPGAVCPAVHLYLLTPQRHPCSADAG